MAVTGLEQSNMPSFSKSHSYPTTAPSTSVPEPSNAALSDSIA
jgi:hypothetical protein